MISFDTNLLLYSLNKDCVEYSDARAFFASLPSVPGTVAICELVLVELYVLLRNPAVLRSPLAPADAVSIIQTKEWIARRLRMRTRGYLSWLRERI